MVSSMEKEDFQLILAVEDDFDLLTSFYRDAIEHTPEMELYGRWIYGLHPTDAMILEYIRGKAMYFCRQNGQIIFAYALTPSQGADYHDTPWGLELKDDQVAVVHLLCVNPRWQHRGMGRLAMEHAVNLAKEMGKKALRLDALACNKPAQRLYESQGFQRRGMAHWFADNVGWTDFCLYERIL